MEEFKIKIAESEYVIDINREQFQLAGKRNVSTGNQIPLSHFRLQDQNWYILWDKRTGSYYQPITANQPIPLSVEWCKIVFITQNPALQDCIGLLILLAEATSMLQQRTGALKKCDQQLKKVLTQFLSKNA
jgi:hypothetical protein